MAELRGALYPCIVCILTLETLYDKGGLYLRKASLGRSTGAAGLERRVISSYQRDLQDSDVPGIDWAEKNRRGLADSGTL